VERGVSIGVLGGQISIEVMAKNRFQDVQIELRRSLLASDMKKIEIASLSMVDQKMLEHRGSSMLYRLVEQSLEELGFDPLDARQDTLKALDVPLLHNVVYLSYV
jgi:hypothetical protein